MRLLLVLDSQGTASDTSGEPLVKVLLEALMFVSEPEDAIPESLSDEDAESVFSSEAKATLTGELPFLKSVSGSSSLTCGILSCCTAFGSCDWSCAVRTLSSAVSHTFPGFSNLSFPTSKDEDWSSRLPLLNSASLNFTGLVSNPKSSLGKLKFSGSFSMPIPVSFDILQRSSSARSRLLTRYRTAGRQTALRHKDAGNTCISHSSGTRICFC